MTFLFVLLSNVFKKLFSFERSIDYEIFFDKTFLLEKIQVGNVVVNLGHDLRESYCEQREPSQINFLPKRKRKVVNSRDLWELNNINIVIDPLGMFFDFPTRQTAPVTLVRPP